ncbi:hypothetical protein PRIPAC_78124 [Pristionchus pacificus]|uniref:V-type proton ATPase subunit a n=1 Tax=Pristionchus pacificus TaxID=54126 RepID=A0A2A6CPQ1_PRIPA|nr:hypothetical protein PRIPAC_78124 [Pristionchus pacificus]|eukprot:PDM80182.1 vha-6 [Pristionchus pacificus]
MAPCKESSIFRSADMSLCQMLLPTEAAYECLAHLGEAGIAQFKDLNEEMSTHQRKFVNEVRRCDEMERKLRFIEGEILIDEVTIAATTEHIHAPLPRDMIELETSFEKIEGELADINKHTTSLKESHIQLGEMSQVIARVQDMLDMDNTRECASSIISEQLLLDEEQGKDRALTELKLVTGMIRRDRVRALEMMLWRVGKGKVFVRSHDADGEHDRFDDDEKSVFILFFSGEQLAQKVRKICDADLNKVIELTLEHRRRVITAAALSIYEWKIKVLKMKMVFHALNMLSIDVTQKCLVGECWIPTSDMEEAKAALSLGAVTAGSSVLPILNEMAHDETPPTHFTTNKFTQSYQNIVDAYGVADYKELNPAPWSIISFPFLFACMYADVGHAIIVLLSGLTFIIFEKRIASMKITDEIFQIFFGGRYIITLMGLFGMYTGFIYNDFYSKSLNVFQSSWAADANNNSCWEWQGLKNVEKWEREAALKNQTFEIMLDPIYCYDKDAGPYPFGVDPVWNLASNRLTFLNSMKMKSAVILGMMQMTFGLCLSLANHINNHSLVDIFFMFIPQIVFLACIFIYLCVQIMVKWIFFPVDQAWIFGQFYPGSNCAPSLLIGLINMFMMTPRTDGFGEFKNGTVPYNVGDDVNLDDFANDPDCSLSFWYPGESIAEKVLLGLALISIPVMLFVKPLYLRWRHLKGLPIGGHSHGEDDGEFSFGDVMVYQAIHTIEFALGCISHTASYLRLWALSLAHAQLSEVLWSMVLDMGLKIPGWFGGPMLMFLWINFACLSYFILVMIEGLSAFLHALRLHWVEFQSKFYSGNGIPFLPFSFEKQIRIVEGLDN